MATLPMPTLRNTQHQQKLISHPTIMYHKEKLQATLHYVFFIYGLHECYIISKQATLVTLFDQVFALSRILLLANGYFHVPTISRR